MNQKRIQRQVLLRKQKHYRTVLCVATRTSNRVLQIRAVRKLHEMLNEIGLQMSNDVCISDTSVSADSLSDEECY